MDAQAKVRLLLQKGVLVSPEMLNNLDDASTQQGILSEETSLEKPVEDDVKVLMSYDEPSQKRSVSDFVSYFNQRFFALESMLRRRQELQHLISINKLLAKRDKEPVSIIGMILDKSITKNNNILLKLEDPTGTISVLIHKNRSDMFEMAKDLVLDEVIGVTGKLSDPGVGGGIIFFANSFVLPDVPVDKELKKAPEEGYAVFTGDIHLGSTLFLEQEFRRFLAWLQGKEGNEEQKRIASLVRYVFIPGDAVEGVGIYPGQEEDLTISDIKEQYIELAKYLKQIPPQIKVVLCAGNHDAGRLSEPQPPLYKDFAEALWKLPNLKILSNPCWVNIGSTPDFSGFDVLMYHGFSMTYYADKVESLRAKGGMKRAELIMKFLLQRRHLAPTHTSNLYIPDKKRDPLVMDHVPDFFITGHIHRVSMGNYRNVSLLNCGCWSKLSSYQEKMGIIPQPAKVLVVNLRTREVKVMNFLESDVS